MIADYFENIATDRTRGVFPAILKACLWLLSLLYGVIIAVLAAVRSSNPAVLPARVISVGNITWGGTGKTPLVEMLAAILQNDGRKPAVLTRGYRRSGARNDSPLGANASNMGDEPYMLSQKLHGIPVIVNSDRVAAGLEAQRSHKADTLILDDGFQQWGLKKDLDIVVIDAAYPFGNGCLIPRGILREPLSALRRADIFVLTNADSYGDIGTLKTRLAGFNPSALIVSARHKPAGFYMLADRSKECGLERMRARPAALVSGIGNPGSFQRLVGSLQIRVAKTFVFPDHHRYSQADIAYVTKACLQQGIETIITTEKDAGKLLPFTEAAAKPGIFVLRVSLEIIEHEELFFSRLRSVYSA